MSSRHCRNDIRGRFGNKPRTGQKQLPARTETPGGADGEHPRTVGGFHVYIAVAHKNKCRGDYAFRFQRYGARLRDRA